MIGATSVELAADRRWPRLLMVWFVAGLMISGSAFATWAVLTAVAHRVGVPLTVAIVAVSIALSTLWLWFRDHPRPPP